MVSRRTFALTAALLTITGAASASAPPDAVVLICYAAKGYSPDSLEEGVLRRIERRLLNLARVVELNASVGEGTVNVEMHFQDGATAHDVAAVSRELDQVQFATDVRITSRTVELGMRRPK